MIPLRVLLVGYFGRRSLQRSYFNTEHKLAAGFVRAGHCVLPFSDRDVAREATVFGTQRLGRRAMARRLAETAAHFRPHVVLFGHCDLLDDENYAAVRAAAPGVRLAAFNVDPAFRIATMQAFAARAQAMDAAFITTGDPSAFTPYAFPAGRLRFMPNPVDPAVETAQVWAVPAADLAWDGLFLGTGIGEREAMLAAIREALPEGFRWRDGGRHRAADRLSSTAYLDALASAAMTPNLPLTDGPDAPVHRLYSSDRIAQLLGQGVTTLTPARAELSTLYDDGVVEYDGVPALVEEMIRLWRDDAARRRIGERGWRLARERTDAATVAAYIAAVTLGESVPAVTWPTGTLA